MDVDELGVFGVFGTGCVIVGDRVGWLVLVWDGGGDALVMVGELRVVVVVEMVLDGCCVVCPW